MDRNFFVNNANTRLHELNARVCQLLSNAMRNNWEDVIKNIPRISNILSHAEFEQFFGKLEIQGKNPAEAIFSKLGRRGIKLDDLKTSFEALKFEEGLRIIQYPNIPLKSRPLFDAFIKIKSESRLELNCETTGFPYPQHIYYKNGIQIFIGNPLIIDNVNANDSGDYCVDIIQDYRNERFFTQVIVEDTLKESEIPETLKISLKHLDMSVDVGTKRVELEAFVNNYNDLSKLHFQWFKRTEKNQDEAILNNPTAKTNRLILEDISIDDDAKYTCQVTDGRQTVLSAKPCKVRVNAKSPYDLKMALIIGNGDYNRFDCNECKNSISSFSNLTVGKNLVDLKNKLEENDFIVMSYIDLEAETFLRVIRLFKEKCEAAENVLAFIYIGAHGFHRGINDYAVPVNIQDIYHENGHKLFTDIRSQTLSLCTLRTLLENFFPLSYENNDGNYISDDQLKNQTKFSVICFWDLCRDTSIHFPVDSYSANCKELQYSIIYCCNVGALAYEHQNKGSYMLDLFLKEFKENMPLINILEAVERRHEEIKKDYKKYEIVSGLKLHTTVGNKCILSLKAKRTAHYKNLLDDVIFHSTKTIEDECISQNGERIRFNYTFLRDDFINSIKLEIKLDKSLDEKKYKINVKVLNRQLKIEEISENFTYRIKGIQNLISCESFFHDFQNPSNELQIIINFDSSTRALIRLSLLDLSPFLRNLYSDSITKYIRYKQNSIFLDLSCYSGSSSVYGDDHDSQNDEFNS